MQLTEDVQSIMNLDLYYSSIFCKWLCLLLGLSSVFVERVHSLGSFKTLRTFACAFYPRFFFAVANGAQSWVSLSMRRRESCSALAIWAAEQTPSETSSCSSLSWLSPIVMIVYYLLIGVCTNWCGNLYIYINHTDTFQLVYDWFD